MSYTYFAENLRYITAVTEMLNGANLPEDKYHYIEVRLVASGAPPILVGKWSDEFGNDTWQYMPEDHPRATTTEGA